MEAIYTLAASATLCQQVRTRAYERAEYDKAKPSVIACRANVQSLVERIPKWPKLPTALYLTLINTYMGCDISPFQDWIVTNISKVELMALCTPILAYAGIAIGKDLDEFKKQGVKIIIVSILTFIGTFVGSAVIAEVVLKATGGI